MKINKITDDITYYNDISETFREQREALITAGIWSINGLLGPMENTSDLWTDSVGKEHVQGDVWTPDNEISDKRTFTAGNLSKFDKIINECIKEYKESHSIKKENDPISATVVKRNKKGHNLRIHSVGDGYRVVFYLNDDYVGGQISFSTKEDVSINPLVHPKYPENIDQIDAWIKPEPYTVIIMPSYINITEHVISSWNRYTISVGF
jgi:mRNA-degrading endonuclease RelE of RelBE toxin-antitoxin system